MSDGHYDQPVLIGQTGPLNGNRWKIQGDLMIGRDDECHIIISDRQVSRFHARISRLEDQIVLEDLASKNGTYLNGDLISEIHPLKDGDLLQVGLIQQFVFLSSDATLPLGPGVLPVEPIHSLIEKKGSLILDKSSRRVWISKNEVLPPLSVPQFRLLELLSSHEGQVVSREEIVVSVWGGQEAVGVSEQAIDALVRRLRDRLAQICPDHEFIVTVRGYGLRFENARQKR